MNPQGIIFDIQRGSFVDGPGIRTVVFFKGCNLDCAWCHNPESKDSKPQMLYYKSRCIGCGRCRSVCRNDAIHEDLSIDVSRCILCGDCTLVCHTDARCICGKLLSTGEIMSEITKDAAYYHNSEGGVTFSGGECMLQHELLFELLTRCYKENIQTAVDTAGNVPWERFKMILSVSGLFLYDLKQVDEVIHKHGTGASNRLILSNLERLLELCPEKVILRIPLIPGFNDDESSLAAIGHWIGSHNRPKQMELLPFHMLGEHKAEALGKRLFSATPPSEERLEQMKKIIFTAMEEK